MPEAFTRLMILSVLWHGGYVRCGQTGRGQIWWNGQYYGHAGPRLLRQLKNDPRVVERTRVVSGVPIRGYCSIDLEEAANGPE